MGSLAVPIFTTISKPFKTFQNADASQPLGFIHEHQNPKTPIQWNRDAVIQDLSGPPNNWSLDVIERNMFDTYALSDVVSTERDDGSIMMYPIPAKWTYGKVSVGLNSKLSPRDKELVRKIYH